MGTNLTATLESAPQTESVVCLIPVASTEREVLRCPQCQLVQYRTQNSHCRRCRADVDLRPAPAAAPVLAVKLGGVAEPGVETAEATGVPVPDVAGAIRHWRQRRGLSQRQLAERMHVPRTYVSKIENDKATPTLTSLERMALAMGTSVASLLAVGTLASPQDAFLSALLPYLGKLGPQHRERLLQASQNLAAC
ncbi:MAG TPA: helix-turn-helix transcriptional regulator [Terriglobales bacterium]|jgi:transcriptional regulator with XRE-family HTH domain